MFYVIERLNSYKLHGENGIKSVFSLLMDIIVCSILRLVN